jgi:hypothetical protein
MFSFGKGIFVTTGRGTTAQTNLTITAQPSCDFIKDRIDFGTVIRGTKNWSEQYVGFTNSYWILQNDGNTNITVNLTINTQLWSPTYQNTNWWARCNNSLSPAGVCNSAYQLLSSAIGSQITVASKIRSEGCCDNVSIYNNVSVPIDEPTGYKTGTVQYTCYSDE